MSPTLDISDSCPDAQPSEMPRLSLYNIAFTAAKTGRASDKYQSLSDFKLC